MAINKWNKQEQNPHITREDENQKVCISFIISQDELSICRASLLWAECHQLPQILTTSDYERQHTQVMLVLMFSIENI